MKAVFAGGGTGGHVFPALAIAQKLKKNIPDFKIVFIGKTGKIEEIIAKKNKFTFYNIPSEKFSGVRLSEISKFIFQTISGFIKAVFILNREKPDFIIGCGGYVSFPTVLAAILLMKPVYLIEQNSLPGKVNRILSPFARKVFFGMPLEFDSKKNKKWIWTGNPLRGNLVKKDRSEVLKFFNLGPHKKYIGVVGGSQGARFFNEIMPQTLKLLGRKVDIGVIHICGKGNKLKIKKTYRDLEIEANVLDFLEDMANIYSSIDIIVSRSGALTISEISVFGVPAVFIPYPYAAQDHQKLNAKKVSGFGAAIWMHEAEVNPNRLAEVMENILEHDDVADKMRTAWKNFVKGDSVGTILSYIKEDLENRKEKV
ncbi:MAG: undecaprenyldiphospho-muramoylpentapeptide beta-N-acetylglucosaminyltransferase [Candidatus Auribacterota bacterium]|nr:undecaprenyldiphospho-muramoylpentapeptide beta-N-acetylglucosaminyltransferase [Candidatus Auribacterota bacterium]